MSDVPIDMPPPRAQLARHQDRRVAKELDEYRCTYVAARVVAAMTPPVASVVIPAHDEEAVIARCLRTLLDGASTGELDVVAVANACHDATANIARSFGVRVIETPHLGKPNALRLGDSQCKTFPRVYLDADAELSCADLRTMIACLALSPAIACAPRPELDLTGVGPVVRRAHIVHDRLVAPTRGLSGPTVYMLSEAAHDRVFPIPDVISDDGWVHRNLAMNQWIVVNDARCVLRPARTLGAAVRRRARARCGNRELDAIGIPRQQDRLGPGDLVALVRSSEVTPVDAACYLLMLIVDHVVTLSRRLRGTKTFWSADRTSRTTESRSCNGAPHRLSSGDAGAVSPTARIRHQQRKRDEMQTSTNHSLDAYVEDLVSRRAKGMHRGAAAALIRRVTSMGMRDSAKVWGTRVFAPRSRRQASRLANGRTDLRLHLGSGTNRLEGWINVDILGMRPDLLWDLRGGIPFPRSCAQEVFLEHVLEHFELTHVLGILRECRRVLAPGGLIRVGVPDFGKYLDSYSGDRAFIKSERPGRPTPLLALAEVALFHGHRSVWDAETLTLALVEAGFDDVRVCAHGESALGHAPDAEHRRSESIYAEARTPV